MTKFRQLCPPVLAAPVLRTVKSHASLPSSPRSRSIGFHLSGPAVLSKRDGGGWIGGESGGATLEHGGICWKAGEVGDEHQQG